MMSLATIDAMSRKAAAKAAREKKEPFIVEAADIEAFRKDGRARPFPFPNIGSYRPKGWKLLGTLFCDATGWGEEDEPALTREQLIDRLKVGHGYAVIEVGQFQVYVGEFVRVKAKGEK